MDTQLKTQSGYLSDDIFCNSQTCLVFAVNCISCEPYGLSRDLVEKYPYIDVYSNRRRLHNLQRCVREDRAIPGTIIEYSNNREKNLPYIAAAVLQYGIAGPIEKNLIAQRIVVSSRDRALVAGLEEDTQDNRIEYFKSAIEAISDSIRKNPDIMQVVLPAGIGRTCARTESIWNETYRPFIEDMHDNLKPYGVEVLLLVKEEERSYSPKSTTGGNIGYNLKKKKYY